MGSGELLAYAAQTRRHARYGRFPTHHVMVCHSGNAKDAGRIESARPAVER